MNRLLAKADSQDAADDRIKILEAQFPDHTFETKTNPGEARVEIQLTGVNDETVKTGVNIQEPDVETMKRIAQGLYIPQDKAKVGKQAATAVKDTEKKAFGSIAGTPGAGGGGGTATTTK